MNQLLIRLKKRAGLERRVTASIIKDLIEVERSGLYAEMGYPSLIKFCVGELGYSESAAYRRHSVIRAQQQNPKVLDKVESGELTLSTAAQLNSLFQQANRAKVELPKAEMIETVLNLPAREAESKIRTAAREHGLKSKKYSEPLQKKMEKVKDLLSNKHPSLSDEDLIHLLCDQMIAKFEKSPAQSSTDKKSNTRYKPKEVERVVWKRDEGSCQFVDPVNGRICGSRRFLQFHHVIPFALGGETSVKNLSLRCATHNKLEAKRDGLTL